MTVSSPRHQRRRGFVPTDTVDAGAVDSISGSLNHGRQEFNGFPRFRRERLPLVRAECGETGLRFFLARRAKEPFSR